MSFGGCLDGFHQIRMNLTMSSRKRKFAFATNINENINTYKEIRKIENKNNI